MDKKTISTMKKMFDDIMHTTEDGTVEFWYARELMGLQHGVDLKM